MKLEDRIREKTEELIKLHKENKTSCLIFNQLEASDNSQTLVGFADPAPTMMAAVRWIKEEIGPEAMEQILNMGIQTKDRVHIEKPEDIHENS